MKKKVCCRCRIEKDLDQFSKRKGVKGGLGVQSYCKACISKINIEFSRTKHGVVCLMYCRQKRKSSDYGWDQPNYSLQELKNWIFDQKIFHDLFDKWVDSGFISSNKPSGDRLDDYKPYSLDNLRVVTWGENRSRYVEDKKNGINTKDCTSVSKFDLDGNFIEKYYSISQAARSNGILKSGIGHCCKGRFDTYKGYIWKYDI